ncbi:MAG: T9SS type A sorting domain-containing protein [Phaeodactylibacter sp.]|nr:T9SS type A sorting domain-containing protein [Phaeodactylibacter sp.]
MAYRIIFLLLAVTFSSTSLRAQTKRILHEFGFYEGVRSLIQTEQGHFLMHNSGRENGAPIFRNKLLLLDKDLNMLGYYRLQPVSNIDIGYILGVREWENGGFMSFQKSPFCQGSDFSFQFLDSTLSTQEEINVTGINYHRLYNGRFSDGSILVDRDDNNFLIKLDELGQVSWQHPYEEEYIISASVLPDDHIIVYSSGIHWGAIPWLRKLSEEGEVLLEKDLSSLPKSFTAEMRTLGPDKFLQFFEGVVRVFDSDSLNLLHSLEIDEGLEIVDLEAGGEKVVILLWSNTESAFTAKQYDAALNLLNEYALPTSAAYEQVALSGDSILLAGTFRYGGDSPAKGNKVPFLKWFGFSLPETFSERDVGVESVSIDTFEFLSAGQEVDFLLSGATVSVRNHSDTIVNKLTLNLTLPPMERECVTPFFQRFAHTFEELDLMPGEEMDLEYPPVATSFAEPSDSLLEVCFWASLPDDHPDFNNTNDYQCQSLLVTSTKFPEVRAATELHLFPNPSAGPAQLSYRLPGREAGEVRIYNSLGQEVARYPLQAQGGQIQIDRQPSGVYFVLLYQQDRPVQQVKWVQR